jgi:hypothetical protein
VWYIDANGVETLWVGREDGSAWPAVGYKEAFLTVQANASSVTQLDVDRDNTGLEITVLSYSDGNLQLQTNETSNVFMSVAVFAEDTPNEFPLKAFGRAFYSGVIMRITIPFETSADEGYRLKIRITVFNS